MRRRMTDLAPSGPTGQASSVAPLLVVDDDPDIRWMIAAFLENEGFVVETAGTGQEALDLIERLPPRLVILDMHLPDMDGAEVIRKLRDRAIEVSILLLTAAREAREQAQELGALAYVSKPLSLPLLLRRIDGILGPDASRRVNGA
jgi:DNA-binding response OmpR family regulator